MSNRLLSVLIIIGVFLGLYGVYYYFFALSTGNITLVINGSGTTTVVLTSEFGNRYDRECEKQCSIEAIPAVTYTLSITEQNFIPFTKTIILGRGETKQVVIALEREAILSEQTKKKEETITTIKLKKDIQDSLETTSGSVIIGYRKNALYYALPNDDTWNIFIKKIGEETRKLFSIPNGTLSPSSLDIYEEHIALTNETNIAFYSLESGTESTFKGYTDILSVKDTLSDDSKIITTPQGVFLYDIKDQTGRENPLYDDIIQLETGEIVALIKKTSKDKQGLLSLEYTGEDYVLLIGKDTRERRTLFKTPKNGKILRYIDEKILFTDEEGGVFVVENMK